MKKALKRLGKKKEPTKQEGSDEAENVPAKKSTGKAASSQKPNMDLAPKKRDKKEKEKEDYIDKAIRENKDDWVVLIEKLYPRGDYSNPILAKAKIGLKYETISWKSLIQAHYEYVREASDFKYEKKIDEGGFGIVWLATDAKTGRACAVKELHCKNLVGRDLLSFIREIHTCITCQCRFVVPFVGYTITPPYLVITEYMPEGNLWERVNLFHTGKSLDGTELTKVAMGLAYAMKLAHEKRILHRDLKAPNILLDSDKLPRLCDWGLARTSRYERMSLQVGTASHVSPEVIENDTYDEKSDVYGFAILLYEMVEGHNFFGEKEENEIFEMVLNKFRPGFKKANNAMKELIRKCWSQRPEKRPSFDEIFRLFMKGTTYFKGASSKAVSAFGKEIVSTKARDTSPKVQPYVNLDDAIKVIEDRMSTKFKAIAAKRKAKAQKGKGAKGKDKAKAQKQEEEEIPEENDEPAETPEKEENETPEEAPKAAGPKPIIPITPKQEAPAAPKAAGPKPIIPITPKQEAPAAPKAAEGPRPIIPITPKQEAPAAPKVAGPKPLIPINPPKQDSTKSAAPDSLPVLNGLNSSVLDQPKTVQFMSYLSALGPVLDSKLFPKFYEKVAKLIQADVEKRAIEAILKTLVVFAKRDKSFLQQYATTKILSIVPLTFAGILDPLGKLMLLMFDSVINTIDAQYFKIIMLLAQNAPEVAVAVFGLFAAKVDEVTDPVTLFNLFLSFWKLYKVKPVGKDYLRIVYHLMKSVPKIYEASKENIGKILCDYVSSKIPEVADTALAMICEFIDSSYQLPWQSVLAVLCDEKRCDIGISVLLRCEKLLEHPQLWQTLVARATRSPKAWTLVYKFASMSENSAIIAIKDLTWMTLPDQFLEQTMRIFMILYQVKRLRPYLFTNNHFAKYAQRLAKLGKMESFTAIALAIQKADVSKEHIDALTASGFFNDFFGFMSKNVKNTTVAMLGLAALDRCARVSYSKGYLYSLNPLAGLLQAGGNYTASVVTVFTILSRYPECANVLKTSGLVPYFQQLQKKPELAGVVSVFLKNVG